MLRVLDNVVPKGEGRSEVNEKKGRKVEYSKKGEGVELRANEGKGGRRRGAQATDAGGRRGVRTQDADAGGGTSGMSRDEDTRERRGEGRKRGRRRRSARARTRGEQGTGRTQVTQHREGECTAAQCHNHAQSRPCARPTGPHINDRPKQWATLERATAMVLRGTLGKRPLHAEGQPEWHRRCCHTLRDQPAHPHFQLVPGYKSKGCPVTFTAYTKRAEVMRMLLLGAMSCSHMCQGSRRGDGRWRAQRGVREADIDTDRRGLGKVLRKRLAARAIRGAAGPGGGHA
jgi:hypothetical protein